jgi:NitT/TauT family transport system ATP-binding protein
VTAPAALRVDPLIAFANVEKTFATRDGPVHALRDVSFSVGRGEFVSIVGPSGCGKSTLLKIVGGLATASRGSVEVAGKAVAGPPDGIGIVFQSPVLLPWRDVLENIMLQIDVRRLPRARHEERARALVKTVGLAGFERRRPWELSGGMQQRVAICRALVHDPDLLLMDEPFGALDAMTRESMNLELQRVWAATKKTVLFITHSIPEAVFLSDRIVVMTERPGTIAAIYDVPLGRPRRLEDMGNPAFVDLVQTVRRHFHAEATVDL